VIANSHLLEREELTTNPAVATFVERQHKDATSDGSSSNLTAWLRYRPQIDGRMSLDFHLSRR
jgi:hypothetical protein